MTFQDVNISALRDRFEKVSGNKLGAWQAIRCFCARHRQAGWEIKQHTGEVSVALEDCRQKLPMTAAHIHDTRKRAEIVRFGDSFVAALVERHHGTLEQGSLVG